LRDLHRGEGEVDRELLVLAERPADADVPRRTGTFFPLGRLPTWAQVLGNFNPLIHCVQLVRHGVSAFAGVADIGHLAYLVVFGRGLARLAIRFMQRRLIL
jgi:hypothetical protein